MPVMEIYSPLLSPPEGLLELLCAEVSKVLSLPEGQTWALWNGVPSANFSRAGWDVAPAQAGPVVFVHCKETYTSEQVGALMRVLQVLLVAELKCDPKSVFIALTRVRPFELFVRGGIWEGDN